MFGLNGSRVKNIEDIKVESGSKNGKGFIKLNDIYKSFTTAAGEFPVLKGITADFDQGEFVGVIGKSGSGKSTLINMISGIDRPSSGEVFIGGTGVHELSENQMAIWRGRNLGIVFQFFQLLPFKGSSRLLQLGGAVTAPPIVSFIFPDKHKALL